MFSPFLTRCIVFCLLVVFSGAVRAADVRRALVVLALDLPDPVWCRAVGLPHHRQGWEEQAGRLSAGGSAAEWPRMAQ